MRLMAVMAHPDDAEIWCGGTLILHVAKGDAVRICALSYPEGSTRGREAEEGASLIGCEVEVLGQKDAAIRDTDEAVDRLRRSIEAFRPDTVITHWFDDVHPDHESVFRIVRRSLLREHLGDPLEAPKRFPRIFSCDTYASQGLRGRFEPNHLVDVSSVWDKKVAAIRAHRSQPLSFYLGMIEKQCRAHGEAAGTQWAEAFLYLPLFGRPDEGEPLGGDAAVSPKGGQGGPASQGR